MAKAPKNKALTRKRLATILDDYELATRCWQAAPTPATAEIFLRKMKRARAIITRHVFGKASLQSRKGRKNK